MPHYHEKVVARSSMGEKKKDRPSFKDWYRENNVTREKENNNIMKKPTIEKKVR